MATLHLGVLVQPYEMYSRGQTTGSVADILEAQYGIMGRFWDVHGAEIAKNMEKGVGDALETFMVSGKGIQPFGSAMSATQSMFKTFISSREAENVGIPGTPTKAALKGISHRRKHPYQKSNPRRPSFRDTGLYETSFRAWVSGWQH